MVFDRIPAAFIQPERFRAVIEIPKGSKNKYEVDKATGLLLLDRILYTSTHYPANSGFIPRTLSEDGDHLDVLVLCTEPLAPLCSVDVYPIGVLIMLDQGKRDEKIVAIPFGEPQMNGWKDIHDLPPHMFAEIKHFFSVYKELEHKETSPEAFYGAEQARQTVLDCSRAWQAAQENRDSTLDKGGG